MKIKPLIFSILVICFLLIGCSDKSNKPAEQTAIEQPYPVSDYSILLDASYPVEGAESGQMQGPVFTIMQPVNASDTFVHGTGPANVPIILISVSDVGEVLGVTAIDGDGHFSFKVNQPLTPGQIIGLQLGDITGTEFSEGDFLYSDTYIERPFVGLMFDMVTVE